MTAGRRDTLVTFQRATVTQNGLGEEVETWVSVAQEWAAVFYGRGSERREAAMDTGNQPATFVVLDNATTRLLRVKDRAIAKGFVWNVEGIANGRRGELEVTAVASDNQATIGDIVGFEPDAGDGWSIDGNDLQIDIDELPEA